MKKILNKILSYPFLCNYYITTKCNAACEFCDIYKEKGLFTPINQIKQNLYHLKKSGIRFIDFTGGEPLLHPDFPEILQIAKKMGFLLTITTNCILYPKLFKQIRGLIDLLHFSLDAPEKTVHNKIRGVECFDKVMESIKIAKSIGENPDILFTITEESINYLPAMIKLAQTRRCILLCNPVFSYFGNPTLKKNSLNRILSFASEPNVYINRGIIRLMKFGGNSIKRPRCRSVSTTVVISSDNHLLVPCYHNYSEKIPINNNLSQLLSSDKINIYKKKQGRFQFCEGCSISCYFDPSFTYTIDDYFLLSQLSKVKYCMDKYL